MHSESTTSLDTLVPGRVNLLTCSMRNDLDLFGNLATSVDEHVDSDLTHYVVVPGTDLALFQKYQTQHREIIAQEDILPVKARKLPRWVKHFSFIKSGLRRPLYLLPNGKFTYGWILQQYLKIEMSRRLEDIGLMHVDSDVCFYRNFKTQDAFTDGKVRFLRVEHNLSNPMHLPWTHAACDFLKLDATQHGDAHFIENCVLWSTDVARAMVAHIEDVHGKPLHEILFGAKTLSEYYLYGIFAEAFPDKTALYEEPFSYCNSYWPKNSDSVFDMAQMKQNSHSKHCAIAVQSTSDMSLTERQEIYRRAALELT